MSRISTDVLIIGSGLSGLSTALSLAEKSISVTIVTKSSIDVSNSANAQGGIASVVDFGHDSFEKHVEDTILAGAGLNKEEVVRFFVEKGPDAIDYFKELGCRFTENEPGRLDLGKEIGRASCRERV